MILLPKGYRPIVRELVTRGRVNDLFSALG